MKTKQILSLLGLVMMVTAGCSSPQPTKFEQSLFEVSNTIVPRVITVTNLVAQYQTNVAVQTVTLTNTEHQVIQVPMTVTNVVTNFATVTTVQTNFVTVPQLAPSPTTSLITGAAGAIGAPFGVGGLVTTALGGLLSFYLGFRNRALAGNATAMSQAAGALTQNIETLMEVLKQTPQGQAAMPLIKNYLMAHQSEAGVIQTVGELVDQYVTSPDAKASADAILGAMQTIQTTPAKPA